MKGIYGHQPVEHIATVVSELK